MGKSINVMKRGRTQRYEEFTDDDKKLMREMKSYQDRQMTDEHKKIYVSMESGKYNYEFMKFQIKSKVHQLKSYLLLKKSNKLQILGEIWKTVDNTTQHKMTKEELELENDRLDLMIYGVVNNKDGIKHVLLQMMPYVGQLTVDKSKIDTYEAFDIYLHEVDKQVKDLVGYGIL